MRYIIYGAGGIGGAIGARLFEAGRDVVLIARGDHLKAMQERGLTLKTPDGSLTQQIPAVGHPREIEFTDDDVVVLCMKTQDTEPALRDLAEASDGRDLPIICAQNGVENERIASRRYSRVYAMTVWLPAVFLDPGVVLNFYTPKEGVLDCGRFPSGVDATITEVCADLEESKFSARALPDIMRWKYAKLLTNLRTTTVAVCGAGTQAPELTDALQGEARACYAAAGIDYASEGDEERRKEEAPVAPQRIDGERRAAGSAWQSLVRGSGSIETDFVNGEIVLLGALYGVPTPHNRVLQWAANKMARERLQPGHFSVQDLLRMAREGVPAGVS
jgi:2-dehydropantoate 2-reductase